MNIMKWNKIIAEFMGYKLMPCNNGKAWDIGKSIPSKDHLFPIQGVLHTGNELKFHTSWDWLMPVVEKIECTSTDNKDNSDSFFNVMIEVFECNINGGNICICESGHVKIEATYNAVVEFINQYNK